MRERVEEERYEPVSYMEIITRIDATVMRMVPDTPLSQAHRVFHQLGCKHIFIVGSRVRLDSDDTEEKLVGMISKKNFLGFLRDGRVGFDKDGEGDSPDERETMAPKAFSVLNTAKNANSPQLHESDESPPESPQASRGGDEQNWTPVEVAD